MPIYEYRCDACGNLLDALQKISDAPLRDCPECGEAALRRLISAPSFRLKGSGWYETDFKSDKERRRNLAEAAESKSGDGEKSAKSDGDAGAPQKAEPAKPAAGSDKSDKSEKRHSKKPKDTNGSSSAVA